MVFKITKEQADKIISSNNIRDAAKLLGGSVSSEMIIDSMGKSLRRIIITYDEKIG